MVRLRTLSEAECYARCYGGLNSLQVSAAQRRRPRYELDVTGEALRVLFEERLDAREPEAEAEAA